MSYSDDPDSSSADDEVPLSVRAPDLPDLPAIDPSDATFQVPMLPEWQIQVPDTSQLPDINPNNSVFQAPTLPVPSIMGGVDFSGGGLPVQSHVKSPSSGLSDIAGKIWNLPNTVAGLAYGGVGYLAGQVNHALGGQKGMPSVQIGNNAVQFTNNPLAGLGAITIGNAEVFGGSPADTGADGNPMGVHEEQHTYQGQQLGPLYLPSNLLGGLAAEVVGRDWHGPQNWNETGPQQNPPVPWPK